MKLDNKVFSKFTKTQILSTILVWLNAGTGSRTALDFSKLILSSTEHLEEVLTQCANVQLAKQFDQSMVSYLKICEYLKLPDMSKQDVLKLATHSIPNIKVRINQLSLFLLGINDFIKRTNAIAFLATLTTEECNLTTEQVVERVAALRKAFSVNEDSFPGGVTLDGLPLVEELYSASRLSVMALRTNLESGNSMIIRESAMSAMNVLSLLVRMTRAYAGLVNASKDEILESLAECNTELDEANAICVELQSIVNALEKEALAKSLIDKSNEVPYPKFTDFRSAVEYARRLRTLIANLKKIIATNGEVSLELMEMQTMLSEARRK